MSLVKRMIERHEDQRQVATEIAIDAKVLVRCPYHGEVYDADAGGNEPAYKLGNYRLSHGQLGTVFSSSREMTDAVKAAVEDAGIECCFCAKEQAD